jgi:predicted nucleic acid-binding protein
VKIALDTNVLVYAEGVNGSDRKRIANELVQKLTRNKTHIPVQVLAELFYVLKRKTDRTSDRIRLALLNWQDMFPLQIETSSTILFAATNIAAKHNVPLWDAIILSAADDAECRLLLSEDFQDGFTWNSVTVVNPFAQKRNHLLSALLDNAAQKP